MLAPVLSAFGLGDWRLGFETPEWLLVWPVGALAAWFLARRSLAGLRGAARWGALVIRLFVLAALVLALANPRTIKEEGAWRVVFVLDVSQSIPDARDPDAGSVNGLREARTWIEQVTRRHAGPDDRAAYVIVGGEAGIEIAFPPEGESAGEFLVGSTWGSVVSRQRSNLAAGVRLAATLFPPDCRKKIVLLTDGNENLGDAGAEIDAVRRAGITLDVYPIRFQRARDFALEQLLVTPRELRPGDLVDLELVTRAARETRVRPLIRLNGRVLEDAAPEVLTLRAGRDTTRFRLRVPQVAEGESEPEEYHFQAELTPERAQDDAVSENNRAESFGFALDDHPRVLILEGARQAGEGADLEAALRLDDTLEVQRRGIGLMPRSLSGYRNLHALIFVNVPADEVSERQMKMIQAAVRDFGMGFVMIGGNHTFGASGYNETPIEEILPVEMEPKDEKVMPMGCLGLVLHTCEIPGQQDWGKRVAKKSIEVLNAQDEAVVVYYDYGMSLFGAAKLFERQPVGNAAVRRGLFAKIDAMQNGDMPDFEACVKTCFQSVNESRAAKKHIILISDGDPSPPSPLTLAAMRAAQVTMSTVLIGPDGNAAALQQTMAAMARQTGGNFYNVVNPEDLPRIFIKEAVTVKRGMVFQETFTPRLVAHSPALGDAIGDFPELGGYVLTSRKTGVETPPVVPLVSPKDDPILAHWQYGLGKTAAFTSDARADGWAGPWVAWPRFAAFWQQLVRWCLRRAERSDFKVVFQPSESGVEVMIEGIDDKGRFVNDLDFDAQARSPSMESLALEVQPVGNGRYRALLPMDENGVYFFNASYLAPDGVRRYLHEAYLQPAGPEFRDLSHNEAVLEDLARRGAGILLDPDSLQKHPFQGQDLLALVDEDLWPLFVLIALGLFFFDVFYRRVDLGLLSLLERRWQRRLTRRQTRKAALTPRPAPQPAPDARPTASAYDGAVKPASETEGETPPAAAGTPAVSAAGEPSGSETPATGAQDDAYMDKLLEAKRRARKRGP